MKKQSHDLTETVDKQQYKKRYLVRKLEEQEAKEEIEDFKTSSDPTRLDGLGPIHHERS